jgi:hypothetical protein
MKSETQSSFITLKEARRLLGKDYASLPDTDIQSLITDMELMAEIAIKRIKKEVAVPKST